MIILWKFLAVLFFIGLSSKNGLVLGDEDSYEGADSDIVGSPFILKGINKLKLLEGAKKIKLKLTGLGLKKKLLFSKFPLLAAANPFAKDGIEQKMDGTDSYYIGTPEDTVGAHMWGGQTFDPNFHPENVRYEIANNGDSRSHHDNIRTSPNVGVIAHPTEYQQGHFDSYGRPHTEYYRAVDDRSNSMLAYQGRREDSFEYEGQQESQYKANEIKSPNDDLYEEMERAAHEQMRHDNMQRAYMKPTIAVKTNNPHENFVHRSPELVLKGELAHKSSEDQYDIKSKCGENCERQSMKNIQWNSSQNIKNSQQQITEFNRLKQVEKSQQQKMGWTRAKDDENSQQQMMEWNRAKHNENYQQEMMEWNQAKHDENYQKQMKEWNRGKHDENYQQQMIEWNQAKHDENYQKQMKEWNRGKHDENYQQQRMEWNQAKHDENSQPQMMKWQPISNNEMIAAVNSPNDNMSHIQREKENVNPVIMQDYLQAVKGYRHEHKTRKMRKYYKKDVEEEVEVKKIRKKDRKSKDMEDENEMTTESHYLQPHDDDVSHDDGVENETLESFEDETNSDVRRTQEKTNLSKINRNQYQVSSVSIKNRHEIPSSRSVADSTESTDEQRQIVPNNNWKNSGKTYNTQGAKSVDQAPQNSQLMNKDHSKISYFSGKNIAPLSIRYQQAPQMDMEGGSRATYYRNEPQKIMLQQYPRASRSDNGGKPEVVIDNQPITAVILPPDSSQHMVSTGQSMSMMSEPQIQYQPSTHETDRSMYMAPQHDNPSPAYMMQYTPEQQTGPQYRNFDANPTLFGYSYDQAEYRTPMEGPQHYSSVMGVNQQEVGGEQPVGEMEPQISSDARTFHKGHLFGIKQGYKKSGNSYGSGYNYGSGNSYGSGHYHGSHGYSHSYGNHGYSQSYGNHGYSQNYYGHNSGYLGQQNPSKQSQEATSMNYMQPMDGNPMTDLVASESSNDYIDIIEPQESTCSCARTWPEDHEHHEDKRLESFHSLRSKRSVTSPAYYTQKAGYFQNGDRNAERAIDNSLRRNIFTPDSRDNHMIQQQTQESFNQYSSHQNAQQVIDHFQDNSYYNTPQRTDNSVNNQPNIREVTLDPRNPTKIDPDIYKTLMEHTEQSIRDALEKASADPVQFSNGNIVLNEDDLKSGGHINQSPMYDSNSPITNHFSEQSSINSVSTQLHDETIKNYPPEIIPSPSEKSVMSYIPQGMSDYQFQDQYPSYQSQSPLPSYQPPVASNTFDQPSYTPNFMNPHLPNHNDPLEALKMFDMAGNSGSSFQELLDIIKAKLLACCEKCKNKILKGIHEKIAEQELEATPAREMFSKKTRSHHKPTKDIYREIESLGRHIWKKEKDYLAEKMRHGSKSSSSRRNLNDKKARLKKLFQYLDEMKKTDCCSDESCSEEKMGSNEQYSSVEISILRKPSRSGRRKHGSRDEANVRSRKSKSVSSGKSSRKLLRRKSKDSYKEELNL